jgi:8-oxo-dGTP pyrophosphatase MutT (NUDIX family)
VNLADWPCVAAARAHDPSRRVPFWIGDACVGSVAREHLGALRALDVERALAIEPGAVRLLAPERDAALAALNRRLREEAGLIRGWRNETYAIVTAFGEPPLALTERAAARFWGTLTFGAHANGYVAGPDGRPAALWIARRALTKATDPGLLDNLVGGGVPWGQTPWQTLVREGDEEAGLDAALMQQHAVAAGSVDLHRDVAEGLQREQIFVFDLALPEGVRPVNRDGEVAEFRLLPIDEALRLAASDAMTVDAALVTRELARRWGL